MSRVPLYSVIPAAISGIDSPIFEAEGLVGSPAVPLFARNGARIIVKLKGCDLYGLELN
jgi:hypothetical protein